VIQAKGVNVRTAATRAEPPKAEAPERTTTLEEDESYGISGSTQRFMMMQKLAEKSRGSRVVVLRNMVEKDDVDEDLEGEVQGECEKHGQVDKVSVTSMCPFIPFVL
jgi:hypothetical protein